MDYKQRAQILQAALDSITNNVVEARYRVIKEQADPMEELNHSAEFAMSLHLETMMKIKRGGDHD
ncbi:hypothetical protein [Ligilactobacillus agilis]|uniref:hypothetical protein n=1 Tax=Ligilactobacillus agilis TaxID=1601 RepID=UPI003F8A77B4